MKEMQCALSEIQTGLDNANSSKPPATILIKQHDGNETKKKQSSNRGRPSCRVALKSVTPQYQKAVNAGILAAAETD
jgi:hypothetical protein